VENYIEIYRDSVNKTKIVKEFD